MSPAQGRTAAATSCRRVLLFGVLPFVAGVWLVLVTFRHQGLPERLQAGQALTLRQNCSQAPGADGVACDCIGAAAGNGTAEGLLATRFGAGGLDELVSASGNASIAAAGTGRLPGGKLESIFLFVGILSGRGYRHRRLAVREAWATGCQQKGVAVCRFILSEDEITPQVQKELDEFGDIVFVKEKTNYKSILVKTYFVLEYAALHYDVRYILKTDDDAYINISAMLRQLRLLCQTPDCRNERLYMGKMAKESEVLLQPGHKWNNILFHNHTGLKMYPNYMMGGGYVLSGDVVTTLININRRMKLIFTPIEDATLGFWLMAMDLRHIDHAKFMTSAAPCCFKAPVRREGQRIVTRFQLMDEMEDDLCSEDPWLVMHKIDSPTKMRYVGNRVAACNASDPSAVPKSIAEFVKRPGPPADDAASAKAGQGAAGHAVAVRRRRRRYLQQRR